MSEKFIDCLNELNILITKELESGKITKVLLKQSTKTLKISLEFANVIRFASLEEIMMAFSEKFQQELKFKKTKFTVRYLSVSYEYLEEYFLKAIEICSKSFLAVKGLLNYSYQINNNCIKMKVNSDDEKKVIEKNFPIIKAFLENYGFKNVVFESFIDYEETPLFEKCKAQQKVIEGQVDAELTEKYYRQKSLIEAAKTTNSFQKLSSKETLTITLDEIPLTGLEVEEFSQTRGTLKIEFTAVVVTCEARSFKSRQGREFNLFTAIVTDYKDSITIKRFFQLSDESFFKKEIKANTRVVITGKIQWDDFADDVVIMCDKINLCGQDTTRYRFDAAETPRVELLAHTKMSILDSILDVSEYVECAKRFNHKALAVTDFQNCHVLPDFFRLAKKNGLKPIAGLEGLFVDDDRIKIAFSNEDINLNDATYTLFDIETTGLCINFNEIIEIGAIKVKGGMVIDEFSEYVKIDNKIPEKIVELTSISNEVIKNADYIDVVLPKFNEFIQNSILVAHNASFDYDFIYSFMDRLNIKYKKMPCIDTLSLARCLYGGKLKKYNLAAVAKFLKAEIEQQHRAIFDTKTLNNFFFKMLNDCYERKVKNYNELNGLIDKDFFGKTMIPNTITILVKNKIGLKNFYKIISDSQTTHFYKDARVFKSVIEKNREGLLIGSGDVNGVVFRKALEKNNAQLVEAIKYYDYIEVQPPSMYEFLFEQTKEENSLDYIKETIKSIIYEAKKQNKIVVATGDVQELNADDAKYRSIYLSVARPNGGGPHLLAHYSPIDAHFRTTSEMLNDFEFLGNDLAYEIVVDNTNKIANMIENFELFPSKLYVPRDDFLKEQGIPSMKEGVTNLSYKTAHEMYGDTIPLYVKKRLDRELEAIIGNGYYAVYYISHLLVKNSTDAGYVVGSRGSVGSSFVATMMKITEVNPLKPHYRCPKCKYSAFKFSASEKKEFNVVVPPDLDARLQKVQVGLDLEDAICPQCGAFLIKDGIDIAFETFLGFNGDKVPDIDLNFSSEYQAKAHTFCQETFGFDNAFRAGTISTVMEKTAFAYVRDYYQKHNISLRKCNIERIATFICGSKKTTGQHPGGIVIVPDDIEFTDIIPVQYPPISDIRELENMQWRTSHYDYHSFEANLLKLDILGHDDPTVIKTLMDFVKLEPDRFPFNNVEEIPYVDDDVLSLFSSKTALKIDGDDLDKLSSGTIGIPEFGTNFVRGMLETIKPNKYTDIIKISGLSHGTDVWAKNAEDLFRGTIPEFEKISFDDVIGCRDDIMLDLLKYDLPAHDAFVIMEAVRKGKGLKPEQEQLMLSHGVPKWYIYSCKKIQYMFPKAHATAYVIMALRIGWFKVHRPIYYYAAYFSIRAKELDAEVFASGKNAIKNKINEIEQKIKNKTPVTNKELDLLDELHLALEMVLRGYKFRQIDVSKSDATSFVIAEDHESIYLPFVAIESLGQAVADSIVEARNSHEFTSKSDFELRTKVNKTQFARLKVLGVLDNLPDADTLL